ncbi:hypothetical protein GGR26_001019 [Lewinella marina]|uniref:Uncharacterized protein n=1 Tax=Neolewinella marina TaxID=438751 RepID=A0A2G0CI01_9BACT|nr:hypothetical protein [Neolewinella marina]NJB85274.1 hypothetical protein [Neolewinella marina]PHK99601.1 hypothetical protein CGL56_00695 [Neolewinella marina]
MRTWLLLFLPVMGALVLAGCTHSSGASAQPLPRHLDPEFLRGMTFAHEGYRGNNGYGGATTGPSLDSLKGLNVNAVAIVPYTFMREMRPLDSLPIPDRVGSETDEAVIHCIRQAREQGFTVMLKPQIWVRGSWPGEIRFEDEEGWNRFFAAYRNWMLHYGKMAAAEGVEALCIGTEMVQATLGYPEQWRSLIASLREVYPGKLTYAANWGEEFENITFWSDLDAIGLNSYYPLSMEEQPTDAQLRAGALRWMRLADSISVAYDRPLWLTEVGYRSVASAWQNPHAEAGDRPVSLEAQERCYAALAEAVRSSSRLEGMFIWKWPSYLGHREGRDDRNTGFVPGGKPAGEVLTRLYAPAPRAASVTPSL